LLFNTFENDLYYNIKRMTNINLKWKNELFIS
jgi:hypothetical protein